MRDDEETREDEKKIERHEQREMEAKLPLLLLRLAVLVNDLVGRG